MTRRLPLMAALAGLAVIAVVLGLVLAEQRMPVTGGNNEFAGGPHLAVDPGNVVCQPLETIPAGTGVVRVHAAAADQPTGMRAEIRQGDRVLASGQARWSGAPQDVDLRLGRTFRDEIPDATTCLEPLGTVPTQFWAFGRSGALSAYSGEYRFGMRVRLRYLGPEAETRLASAGGTARRVATARASLLDGWAPWGALAAVLGVLGVLLVAVKRELAP